MLSFLSSCLIGDVSRGSKKTNRCGETFLGGNGCFPKKWTTQLVISPLVDIGSKAVDFSELLSIFVSTHLLGKISYLKHIFLMF